MITDNIEFKIFSDFMDTSLARIAFKQLNHPQVIVSESESDNFELAENEIAVICIKKLDEEIINKAYPLINDDHNIIILTDSEDIILAAALSRLGFKNIFVFPYELQKFKNFLAEFTEQALLSYAKTEEENNKSAFGKILGTSPALQETISLAKKVAQNPEVNILILGETGTGKGLLARAIHDSGLNYKFPFVDIICTAIPATLLESELFGYEKGAFTDAKDRKIGLMELAERGAIFLDEIGDLSFEIQAKLLKVLDNKVMRRLGGVKDISIEARIIAATNRDLPKLVEQKIFREDLYHRLNVVTIKIPPLRERGKDILFLADHFLRESSFKFNKPSFKIDKNLKDFLLNYSWPGNVRELKNAIERAVLLSDSHILNIKDLFSINDKKNYNKPQKSNFLHFEIDIMENDLDSISKAYAQEVLKKLKNNKSKTAIQLGISRPKLDKLLK